MVTVELERVRKSYDDFVAVDDLSFSISPHQIFGLLGPNGAGKTSSIRMMIGIIGLTPAPCDCSANPSSAAIYKK